LVTYKDYIKEFYKLHEKIAKYYNPHDGKSYTDAITLMETFAEEKKKNLKYRKRIC